MKTYDNLNQRSQDIQVPCFIFFLNSLLYRALAKSLEKPRSNPLHQTIPPTLEIKKKNLEYVLSRPTFKNPHPNYYLF